MYQGFKIKQTEIDMVGISPPYPILLEIDITITVITTTGSAGF